MMFISSLRTAVPALVLAVAVPALAQRANDQAPTITNKALIGDAVSDADNARYKDVTEAIKRFSNRDQLSARTFLERAVSNNPKLPPVGVLMARLHFLSGNSAAVRPALEQAVQEDSADDPEPYLLLAEQAVSGQRSIEAAALFDKAVATIEAYNGSKKRKRLFKIRALRGRAAIAAGRSNWSQAEADLREWIAEDPKSADAHNSLGRALFMSEDSGKVREGFEQLRKADELQPDLPNPYATAAMLYSQLGDTKQAMTFFDQAFKTTSNELTTLIPYAQALMQNGDLTKAATVLKKAREANPANRAALLLSGVGSRMSGDLKSAERYLMQALSLVPGDRDVLNQLALTLVESSDEGATARASQFAQVNQRLNPKNADVNISLAWVLYRNGDIRNANAALRQGVQSGVLGASGNFLLAKLLLERGDKENAKRLLNAALANEQGIFVERKEAEELLKGL